MDYQSEVIALVSCQYSDKIIDNSTNTSYHRSSNPSVSIKKLMAEIKMFMNYISSYKKTWLAKQRALEMIHVNREESYVKLPKLLGALQSYVPGTLVLAQTKFVFEEEDIVHGKNA